MATRLRLEKEEEITIRLPDVELEHLSKAPLKLAIAQVRFAPVFAIEERGAIAGFQAKLADRYVAQDPTSARRRPEAGLPPRPAPSQETVWPFHNVEREWTISLSSTSLALEATRYLDFDDFAGELASVLKALHEVFAPQREVRLGLRYANRIDDDRLERRGIPFFVNEQLAGPVGGDLGGDLIASLAELRFQERGSTLAIRHGLVEPTQYLLDFDHFSTEERDFSPPSIVRRIKRFHGLIERLFVWSISERYLNELRRVR